MNHATRIVGNRRFFFFHHYLYGQNFLIRTDHQSLKWLLFKNLEGQLARWIEKIQQYNFEILYQKRTMNRNADGLSRRPCSEDFCNYCLRVELKEASSKAGIIRRIVLSDAGSYNWRKEQLKDPSVSLILLSKEAGRRPKPEEVAAGNISLKVYLSYWDALVVHDGVLFKRWEAPNLKSSILQVIVPRSKIKQILEEAHDIPTGGHFGINKTLSKLRKRFFWATCKKDVEEWCQYCKTCVARKGPPDKRRSPFQIYNTIPFERLQMDILGPLPTTMFDNKYLLVIVDCFTKWVVFPLKNIRAHTVAEMFVNQVISRYGVPLKIHIDQGRNFESHLFQELSNILGIKETRTTPLQPQSDGQVERQHQTILQYLSKFIDEDQKNWDKRISMFLLAYRTSRHETTGITPTELCFGRDLRIPLDLLRGSPPEFCSQENSRDYVYNLKEKLNAIHQQVRNKIAISSERIKRRYDQSVSNLSFEQGQKVWLYNPCRNMGKAPCSEFTVVVVTF